MSGARERLAQALFEIDIDVDHPGGLSGRSYDDVAESLLPVVQALVAEGKAEALEAAAEDLTDLCGPRPWERLRARAAALRATTSGEAGA